MRFKWRNVALISVVVALALAWTVAGCALVLPGGRPAGMPARHVFPVRGGDPVDAPVSYPEAGMAMGAHRMPVERVQFDPTGGILFVEYLSGNRGCHRLVGVDARMKEDQLEVIVMEGSHVALTVACSGELVVILTAVRLAEPVDPLDPPAVRDGVGPGPVLVEPG